MCLIPNHWLYSERLALIPSHMEHISKEPNSWQLLHAPETSRFQLYSHPFILVMFLVLAVLCLVAQSCLFETLWTAKFLCSWDSPGKNTAVGCHALLQGIFPTHGSNPGLPYCRRILYYLSHQGSSWILEWIAYPFSREPSQPRNQTKVSCIAGGFLTSWAGREAFLVFSYC